MNGADSLAYPPDDPSTIESLAVRCERLAGWADHFASGLGRNGHRLEAAWQAPAASAFRTELGQVARLTGSLSCPLHGAARVLRGFMAELVEARRQVDLLRAEYAELVAAHRRALTALPDVPGPVRAHRAQDYELAHAAELARLLARHREVLLDVTADASRAARRVVAAAGEMLPRRPSVAGHEADVVALLPLLAASRRRAGVTAGPLPAGTAAPRVRAWWAALTTDEQDRLVSGWPRRIGALDGLPAEARSRANGMTLDRQVGALLSLRARTERQQRRLDSCLAVRERLRWLRSRRDPLTGEPLVVQLLVFDPSAFDLDGRVAIGIGDVDTADHVAVVVPGLGSDLRSRLRALTVESLRVTTESRRASPASRTATLAWMGYDPPEWRSAASDGAAERGADLLAADLLALQEARDRLPHLTVVGHSYGSTTAGTSLRDHWTGTDDVVLVGSPGPNVETAAELRVPEGHVFVGASSRDPVSYLDHFGADPTHQDFGALRFQAEAVTRNRWMLDADDHSKYFEPRSESLSNVVRVVVGDYESVRAAEYRDEEWLRPDGINSDPEADREPTEP